MRVVSVINLKGGVGKTTTSENLAYGLWKYYGKRVLLIDNDKQGNLSKVFGAYDPDEENTTATLMLDSHVTKSVIRGTKYKNIDIIPANMNLLEANLKVMMDIGRKQQTRFQNAFDSLKLEKNYDFVIIDNAPDINISIINAFVASDDIIIPLQMDEYSFDGMDILMEQIQNCVDDFNSRLRIAGCLCTYYQNNEVNKQSLELLRNMGVPVFNTVIRQTNGKPKEAIYARVPLMEYSIRCGAAQDYKRFVKEYVAQIG